MDDTPDEAGHKRIKKARYGFSFLFIMTKLTLIFERTHHCFFHHYLRYIVEDSDVEEISDEEEQKVKHMKDHEE